ncbi:MAG TPA: CHAT domain-containing protein, partial [Thermoanaerobaculia bacterium]
MSRPAPPVVFLAFANDRADKARTLRNLPQEQRQVREALVAAEQAGHCEVVERANATVGEVLDIFQDARYRDRVVVFHFGGHAGSGVLLFESPEGEARLAHAGSFARFLGMQRGLELVFLNGCSTQGQVQDLLASGVPAVIATSENIPDAVATEISSRFYKALASGAPLRTSFTEAVA